MAEGRQRDAYARHSSLMALMANANRDPKKGRRLRPEDFDPFAARDRRKRRRREAVGGFAEMRDAFKGMMNQAGGKR